VIKIFFLSYLIVFSCSSYARPERNFDFSLGLDYNAAEQTLNYYDYKTNNVKQVAELRGNRLASLTSILLARTEKSEDDFRLQLELSRNNSRFESDVYGFSAGKNHIKEIRKLIEELQHRRIDRRIVATIASFFPEEANISTRFSVYFVIVGNERAAAFVRHVVWNYDIPTFVGDDEGDPVIVVNLARIVEVTSGPESQFIEVLSTTAHECFHAVYSVLQKSLPESVKPSTIAEQLMELTQNEGIAYYLSMQTHSGTETPPSQWFTATSRAFEVLNKVLIELHSPGLTQARARELMMNANLSGSFEGNYGATAGLRMAYEIDKNLGRPALTATLMGGGRAFLLAYKQACDMDGMLPRLDPRIIKAIQNNTH
jgi:hypothetical protein